MAQNIPSFFSHGTDENDNNPLFLGIPWLVKQGMCHTMTLACKNYLFWSTFQKSSLGLWTKTASLTWISESNGKLRKRQRS